MRTAVKPIKRKFTPSTFKDYIIDMKQALHGSPVKFDKDQSMFFVDIAGNIYASSSIPGLRKQVTDSKSTAKFESTLKNVEVLVNEGSHRSGS